MRGAEKHIFDDTGSLVSAFSGEVIDFLKSVDPGRNLHIALSGGSTPQSIFNHLNSATECQDWSRIRLFWGDERCVPPEDKESNFGNARRMLIDPLGLEKKQVYRIRGEEDPETEAARYGQLLRDLLPLEHTTPVFDWIWLGIGSDGHTASLFPDNLARWDVSEPCLHVSHPESGQKRITISGRVINAARRISFIVTGGNKAFVVREILKREGRYREYPASYVAPGSGMVEWFMDREAASLI